MTHLDMVDIFLVVTVFLVSVPEARLLQFTSSPQDGDTVYTCTDGVAHFPWRVSLASGETLSQIQWFHVAETRRLAALTAGGHFVAMPAYGQRVAQLHNAGISLSNVSMEDEGTYVVEVSGHDTSGKFTELHRTLRLDVQTEADSPRVSGGRLHVEQSSSAIKQSGQWHVELTCGTFTFLGQPPVRVVWKTPSGTMMQSSNYSGGKFHLLLPNPVRGGRYSCQILPDDPAASCLPPNDALLNAASFTVEETVARLAILEAENRELRTDLQLTNRSLLHRISLLRDKVQNVAAYKPARQSSTHHELYAKLAVDNNLDNNTGHHPCSHTKGRDRQPWWRVDLGRTFDVTAVIITSRGDCCPERLTTFYVDVFTEDPAVNSHATRMRCQSGIIPYGGTKTLLCNRRVRGRYVRIKKNTEVLELCEVQVMAPLISVEDL